VKIVFAITGIIVCSVLFGIIANLNRSKDEMASELIRLAEKASPEFEYMSGESELELMSVIRSTQRMAGLHAVEVLLDNGKTGKLDSGIMRAIISRESGGAHVWPVGESKVPKEQWGDVKLSKTNDLGITAQHLSRNELAMYKKGGPVWRGEGEIRVDLLSKEGNILAGWCRFRSKLKSASPEFSHGRTRVTEEQLWDAVRRYNGAGEAARAYRIDVRKRYYERFRVSEN